MHVLSRQSTGLSGLGDHLSTWILAWMRLPRSIADAASCRDSMVRASKPHTIRPTVADVRHRAGTFAFSSSKKFSTTSMRVGTAPDVAPLVDRLSTRLFGRHVRRRAEDH